jgi:hypothetical protein
MNERINDLMNEAMPQIDWTARHGVELNNGERMKWYADWFDRFAELIVRDISDDLELHSTCFDGDTGLGVKIAARLARERYQR